VYAGLSGYVRELEQRIDAGLDSRRGGNHADRQALVDAVAGDWWERITRPGDPTAISYCRINVNAQNRHPMVAGRGYGHAGEPSSTWDSILAGIDPDERGGLVLRYVWRGEVLIADGSKKNPEYHGFGEIRFERPTVGKGISKYAEGFYWNVDESNPEHTNYKRAEMKRIDNPDVAKSMREGRRSERQAAAVAALQDWDRL
jgi:hypothetical protein